KFLLVGAGDRVGLAGGDGRRVGQGARPAHAGDGGDRELPGLLAGLERRGGGGAVGPGRHLDGLLAAGEERAGVPGDGEGDGHLGERGAERVAGADGDPLVELLARGGAQRAGARVLQGAEGLGRRRRRGGGGGR